MNRESPPIALIIGCGYLGRRLAPLLLEGGATVFGTARTPESAAKLAPLGIRPLIAEVTQRLTLASLRPALENGPYDLYYMVPPGQAGADPSPRQVLLDGTRNVIATLNKANLRRAVLVSSTAVYAQTGNVTVTADTPPEPGDERGRLLLDAELNWLSAGTKFHVLRLAGLYGPDRIIGMNAILERHPLVGNPGALLNLIHVDDAARLLIAMTGARTEKGEAEKGTGPFSGPPEKGPVPFSASPFSAPGPGRIELGCDNHPSTRIDYYTHLASLLGSPPPKIMDDANAALQLGLNAERLRRASSKSCDNGPTRARTGWTPRYASFREGLAAALSG